MIKLWETTNWQEVSTLKGSQDEVLSILFSPDGKTLFSGTKDGKILAWDGKPRPPKAPVVRRPDDAQAFGLSPPSGIPICWHSNKTFNLWDPLTLRKLPEHPIPAFDLWTNIDARALSPGGDRLAFATTEGHLYLWDVEGERVIARWAGWPSNNSARFSVDGKLLANNSVGFSPDRKLLAAAAGGKGLKLWNLEKLEEVATLTNVAGTPTIFGGDAVSLWFKTNQAAVAVINGNGTVEVWDLLRKARVNNWQPHQGANGVAFMPDGKRLVTVGEDSTAKLWELETQREVRSFGRTLNAYRSVAVSPDGQRIAAGTWNLGIKIWDTTTGQELVTLKGVNDWLDPNLPFRSDAVWDLFFLPSDGNSLISATSYEIRVWRAPSWAEIEAAEKTGKKEP